MRLNTSTRLPRLSVITASHNCSQYLSEAVGSVLSQTFSDLEMVIVDDCSSDGSFELAQSLAKEDARVSTLCMSCNSGPAATRNVGIQNARGAWLGILDADDVAMPRRFEEQFSLIDRHPELIMVSGNSVSINSAGCALRAHTYPTDHEHLIRNLYHGKAFPPHSSMMYRKDCVDAIGAFNVRFKRSQDYDLWLRLSEMGRLASVPQPVVKMRKHSSNISNTEGGKMQYLFWCAAAVCHYLRAAKRPDPSVGVNEDGWVRFWTWLTGLPAVNNAFERRTAWSKSRERYWDCKSEVVGMFGLASDLLSSSHFTALLWEKAFGSSLPKHLAQQWMRL
jgi:glycosyltransferase involved in cell wall biosynthesis